MSDRTRTFNGFLIVSPSRFSWDLKARLSVRRPARLAKNELVIAFHVDVPEAWFKAPTYSARLDLTEPRTQDTPTVAAIADAIERTAGIRLHIEEVEES